MTELRAIPIALLAVSLVTLGFQIFYNDAATQYSESQIDLGLNNNEIILSNITNQEDLIGTQITEGTSSGLDLGFRGTITVLKNVIVATPDMILQFFDTLSSNLFGIDIRFKTITVTMFLVVIIFAVFSAILKWKT